MQVLTTAATAMIADPAAAQSAALQPGAYEVEVRLELPHVENAAARKVVTICVTNLGARGLGVLSDNNPLSACPVSDIAGSADALRFTVACPGLNAARGSAAYSLSEDAFNGAIAMKMGGKNMTMTERQSGRRIGACADPKQGP